MPDPGAMDFEEVRRLLPQSHPFLMVDRVESVEPGKRIVAVRNVTGNEPWVPGHFPGFAIMPAALILEALAQATILMLRAGSDGPAIPDPDHVYLFGSVHARMHRPVVPGDVMRLEVKLLKTLGDGGAAEGRALVGDVACTEAEMYFTRTSVSSLRGSARQE